MECLCQIPHLNPFAKLWKDQKFRVARRQPNKHLGFGKNLRKKQWAKYLKGSVHTGWPPTRNVLIYALLWGEILIFLQKNNENKLQICKIDFSSISLLVALIHFSVLLNQIVENMANFESPLPYPTSSIFVSASCNPF